VFKVYGRQVRGVHAILGFGHELGLGLKGSAEVTRVAGDLDLFDARRSGFEASRISEVRPRF
jgi:hypothetical protein